MDIHRTRFIPYPPSAINALAFSHASPTRNLNNETPLRDPSCLRLAIGRANGNIEIWNPSRGEWVHETTFYGGKDRSIEGLAWIQEPDELDDRGNLIPGRLRLFSIGYANTVTEWNLLSGLPLRNSGGNHGDVWCLAAQPPWEPPKRHRQNDRNASLDKSAWRGQNIVVGCADGTLAVLSTADNDLQFQKFLARPTSKKARVLSVTYKNRDTVVAGCADGTVGIYNVNSGAQIRNITLGPGARGGPKDVLVWAVKVLPWNGNLVIGDSTGEVKFYDGKNYSQLTRLASHDADVLTLAVARDSRLVFSGSMDRRSASYNTSDKPSSYWSKIVHSRYHEHDVKAMAVYEGWDMSVLVSGGLDISPKVIPMRHFGRQYHLSLPITPQRPPIVSAPKPRLIVGWWAQEARIWKYPEGQQMDELPKLLARMGLKGDENITSASMDENGHLLALATAASSRIFQIERKVESEIRLRKLTGIELPGARLVKLSLDGKWIALIAHDNTVKVARILLGAEGEKPRILPITVDLERSSEPETQWNSTDYDGLDGPWGHYRRMIVNVEFSTDSRVLAVGDLAGFIDAFILQGHEDPTAPEVETTRGPAPSAQDDDSDEEDEPYSSNVVIKGQSWKTHPHRIPKLGGAALVMSFRPPSPDARKVQQEPNGNPGLHPTRRTPHPKPHNLPDEDYRLLVVDGHHQIYEFDVLAAKLTQWSRQNPRSSLPPEFSSLKDRVMGCIWDITADRQRLWLYGSSWLFMFNLARNLKDNIDEAAVRYIKSDDIEAQLRYNQKARRKHFRNVQNWQKQSTGAGDRVRDDEVLGLARQMNKFMYDAEGRVVNQVIDTENAELEWKKRRKMKRNASAMEEDELSPDEQEDEDMKDLPPLESDDEEPDEGVEGSSKAERIWWNTHKYRPILGIVPLQRSALEDAAENGEHDTDDDSFKNVPEVVIVERPLWDVDLPPKFIGAMEREKGND